MAWPGVTLSSTDLVDSADIVSSAGGDPDDVFYWFDKAAGRWKAYESAVPVGILRASMDPATGQWAAE